MKTKYRLNKSTYGYIKATCDIIIYNFFPFNFNVYILVILIPNSE